MERAHRLPAGRTGRGGGATCSQKGGGPFTRPVPLCIPFYEPSEEIEGL